jgi:hypothetical protein
MKRVTILWFAFAGAHTVFAQNIVWNEDASGGSCKVFKQHVADVGVHESSGAAKPSSWGITEHVVLINGKHIDDPSLLSSIDRTVSTELQSGSEETGTVCTTASNFRFTFSADAQVSVVEWRHEFNSKPCEAEWLRIRTFVRDHEQRHVDDTARIIDDANQRVAALTTSACGPDSAAANQLLEQRILQTLRKEIKTIRAQAEQAAQALDRLDEHTPELNCTLCSDMTSGAVTM